MIGGGPGGAGGVDGHGHDALPHAGHALPPIRTYVDQASLESVLPTELADDVATTETGDRL